MRAEAPLALLTLSIALAAQAPSPWRDLAVPGGVPQFTVATLGKLVLYRNGNVLRVFSAVTNEWHAHAPSFGTASHLRKDLVLVPESDRWTAFSAYRGTFVPVFVPFATSTMTATDSLAFVTDGSTLHTFSAFTGQWHTRSIPSGWVLETGNRIALLRTPQTSFQLQASAFDAFTGTWHDLATAPAGTFATSIAGGSVVASTLLQEFGFSPLRPGWVQTTTASGFPFPSAPLYHQDGDLAPGFGALFSGLTGTFSAWPAPAMPSSVAIVGNVATFANGQIFAIGASSNTWVPMPTTSLPPFLAPNTILGTAPGAMEAFSALHDTVVATPGSGGAIARNVATAGSLVSPFFSAFSTLTGQWQAPPPNSLNGAYIADNSALWATPTGLVAFAAPTGSVTTLPVAGLTVLNAFAAVNGSTMFAFDALGNRWLSQPRAPGAVLHQANSRLVLATMPGQAIGYSTRGRRLAPQTLAEPWSQLGIGDDVAYLATATHVYAFSGLGDTMTWQGDPIDDYGAGRGTTVRLQARTPAGHFVAFGFGPALPSPLATPFGELWLDPTTAAIAALAPAAGETRAVLPIQIPNSAALRGSLWTQQAITLAPNSSLWLGDPSTLLVQ